MILEIIFGALILSVLIAIIFGNRGTRKMLNVALLENQETVREVRHAIVGIVEKPPAAIVTKAVRISELPLRDPGRFKIETLSKANEFRVYILVDKGLNERYLFLQADNGSLIGLGNVEDS